MIKGKWENKVFVGCLECNPVMDDDKKIWSSDKVCCDCFFEWGEKKDTEKINWLTNLIKENQELRQQLTEVKQKLDQVSAELRKLKNSSVGKDTEKLTQQIIENKRLVGEDKNDFVAEVKEQVDKSEALMREVKINATMRDLKVREFNKSQKLSDKKDIGVNGILVGIIGAILITSVIIAKRNLRKKVEKIKGNPPRSP